MMESTFKSFAFRVGSTSLQLPKLVPGQHFLIFEKKKKNMQLKSIHITKILLKILVNLQ